MRILLLAALSLASGASFAHASEGRFFLLVAGEAPEEALVKAAYREVHRTEPPLLPEVARARLGGAFPRLFASGRSIEGSALEADLKAARAAHFNGQFAESEAAFARALAAVADEPELIAGQPTLFQRLVDGAALRYTNTRARKRPAKDARAEVEAFLLRFPQASPTPSDHPPDVIGLWSSARTALRASFGALDVSVQPLELERSGTCRLLLNGAEVAELPLPGPFAIPRGEHLVQVRCGAQRGWLQRVTVGAAPVSVRVPVRAMLAARGDVASGGIVLVAPSEGDASALVQAVSDAAELDGAVVARTAVGRVELGRWDAAMDGPTVDAVGRIEGVEIEGVRAFEPGGRRDGGGRTWTWVVGGLGLATLGGAVVANVVTADKITAGDPDTEGLKTATVALYVAGGALLATGIILFFVEGDGDGDEGAAAFAPGPGGLVVRF